MHLFYNSVISDNIINLNEEESKHCIRVLRLKSNDIVWVTDGNGKMYKTSIIDDNKNKCVLNIIETIDNYNQRKYKLHLAISPLQNSERLEWFVEKATESGIDEITPILCEHSERKNINVERLKKVAVSAMKQSLKAYLPKINPLVKYNDFIKNDFNGLKGIAYCTDERQHITDWYKKNSDCLILIGPEGDFSQKEIDFALQYKYTVISLGNSRLRTETAAITACMVFNFLNKM
ncbi:MAG: 16S rRNA (uracil(1498)-N(3))-methyltransferase [Bacteroidetes bacterium GWA2_32_17]|nr:MAG: 16S rRNA (uracil(1498)-N(3))-methyltransferase [Bacteroidetes bacterium GWA2_32_17]